VVTWAAFLLLTLKFRIRSLQSGWAILFAHVHGFSEPHKTKVGVMAKI
jgi:hypothetical protein